MRVILFSIYSLISKSGTTMGQAPAGKKWNITEPTLGLIVMSAIFVSQQYQCFHTLSLVHIKGFYFKLPSPDRLLSFEKPGDMTGVNYKDQFEKVLELLVCMHPIQKAELCTFFLKHTFSVVSPLPAPSLACDDVPQSLTFKDGLNALENTSSSDAEDTEDTMPGMNIVAPLETHLLTLLPPATHSAQHWRAKLRERHWKNV